MKMREFSLKFVPKVRINNIPAPVQIMAWRRPSHYLKQEWTVFWRIYFSSGSMSFNKVCLRTGDYIWYGGKNYCLKMCGMCGLVLRKMTVFVKVNSCSADFASNYKKNVRSQMYVAWLFPEMVDRIHQSVITCTWKKAAYIPVSEFLC